MAGYAIPHVNQCLDLSEQSCISLSNRHRDIARKRADELCELNFGIADSSHVAFAEQSGAEFISCDDSLIKKCLRHNVKIWCGNPVAFCKKERLR